MTDNMTPFLTLLCIEIFAIKKNRLRTDISKQLSFFLNVQLLVHDVFILLKN